MLAGLWQKSPDMAEANHPAPNPLEKPIGPETNVHPLRRQLAFVTVGDEVKVGTAGKMVAKITPTAAMHVPPFLRWLSGTPCAGKWVGADHIASYLYPEFCAVHGLEPKPLQTVLKHLKEHARKRSRDVQTGAGANARRVQYFIPRCTRIKPGSIEAQIVAREQRAAAA